MISADDFDAYNRAVSEMSDGLAARAEAEILAGMRANPGASVEECREHAKEVMSGMAQVADEAAATLAAEWYDAQAEAAGARLEPAVTASVYSPETVDKVARYQARKLAKGDAEGFARRCGELVRNDALRSLNETVIANVGRDRDRGARFARVMTGAENCEFCLMLASRGAVYHTRETAGEFRRFHRGCDCKVVPGFSGDPMEALVEGHDPKDAYGRYEAIRKGGGLAAKKQGGVPSSSVLGWHADGFESYGDFVSFVASAESADDLKRRVERIEEEWPKTGLSGRYREMLAGVVRDKRHEFARLSTGEEVMMPGGLKSRFVFGSEPEAKKIFAGKDSSPQRVLRVAGRLSSEYGGNPEEWFHVAGIGWIFDPEEDGKIKLAEVHWMEHPVIGKLEFYFKGWMRRGQ